MNESQSQPQSQNLKSHALAKRCIYCGTYRPLDQFREYYQGKSKGKHYRYCSDCEKIENRRKYLLRMGLDTTDEYAMIIALYDKRLDVGLAAPRSYRSQSVDVSSLVAAQLEALTNPGAHQNGDDFDD